MTRASIAILLFVALLWLAIASVPPLANENRKGLEARSIDEMLALPEDEVDVGMGALLIGKEFDPTVDVHKYLAELDAMALELRSRIDGEKDPQRIIGLMNNYVFAGRGYAYAEAGSEPGVSFLHFLLEEKKGSCAGLSTLYLALAERLDLPTFGVLVPGHLFVRYDSGEVRTNIETTCDGALVSDSDYMDSCSIPETPAAKSFYMRNLTKREVLGALLHNLGWSYSDQDRADCTVQAWRQAVSINPNHNRLWINLGDLYAQEEKHDDAAQAYKRALDNDPDSCEAWCGLGDVYRQKNAYADSVVAYNRALAIDPYSGEAWYGLAKIYHDQHQYGEAIAAYKRSLDMFLEEEEGQSKFRCGHREQDDIAKAWSVLAKTYYEAEGYEAHEVVSACNRIMEADPNLSDLKESLAFTYYLDGKHSLASALDPHVVASLSDEEVLQDESATDLFAISLLIYVAAYLLFSLIVVRIYRRRKTRLRQVVGKATST